jgi:hypothetical protein
MDVAQRACCSVNTAMKRAAFFLKSMALDVEKQVLAPTLLQKRNKIGADTRGAKL